MIAFVVYGEVGTFDTASLMYLLDSMGTEVIACGTVEPTCPENIEEIFRDYEYELPEFDIHDFDIEPVYGFCKMENKERIVCVLYYKIPYVEDRSGEPQVPAIDQPDGYWTSGFV